MNTDNAEQKCLQLRGRLSKTIGKLETLKAMMPIPAHEEINIALRHAQDARMRIGVALTYLKGNKPWENRE